MFESGVGNPLMSSSDARSCTPLRGWMAIEPLHQVNDKFVRHESLYVMNSALRGIQCRRGVIRRIGAGCDPDFQVGQVVVYEPHSAHPHQSCELPAEWFGGTPGQWVFLIRGDVISRMDALRKKDTSSIVPRVQRLQDRVAGAERRIASTTSSSAREEAVMTATLEKKELMELTTQLEEGPRVLYHNRDTSRVFGQAVGVLAVEDSSPLSSLP